MAVAVERAGERDRGVADRRPVRAFEADVRAERVGAGEVVCDGGELIAGGDELVREGGGGCEDGERNDRGAAEVEGADAFTKARVVGFVSQRPGSTMAESVFRPGRRFSVTM